ncbi:hypothetical protein ABZP36_028617 [Zizania latifolia]
MHYYSRAFFYLHHFSLHSKVHHLALLPWFRYWLSVGAQPSNPVQNILFHAGILPPPPMLAMAHKGGPRDRRLIDPMTGRPSDLECVTVVDDPNAPEGGVGAPNKEAA